MTTKTRKEKKTNYSNLVTKLFLFEDICGNLIKKIKDSQAEYSYNKLVLKVSIRGGFKDDIEKYTNLMNENLETLKKLQISWISAQSRYLDILDEVN